MSPSHGGTVCSLAVFAGGKAGAGLGELHLNGRVPHGVIDRRAARKAWEVVPEGRFRRQTVVLPKNWTGD